MATDASASSDDQFAAQLRGFGPVGIVAILAILSGYAVITTLGAVLVLLWTRMSHTPWREIGYVRPRSWIVTVAAGIVFGSAFKLVMKAIVMPLFGADPINHAYHYLTGNRAAIPFTLFTFIVTAGWGEETVYRSFLFERLGKLLGSGLAAKTATVLITSALFSLAHYPVQGLAGMEQAMITGLVFGTIFAVSGRIWMVMIAHAAFDLAAYAIIYWNLETPVAHLVFR